MMMMRNWATLGTGLLLACTPLCAQAQAGDAQAAECAFDLQVSDQFLAMIASWGPLGVDGTDGLCERLRAEGAGLSIVSESGLNEFGAYGTVMIGFIDTASGLDSAEYRVNVSTSPLREEGEREAALHQAMRTALASLVAAPDSVFTSLREELAEARQVFAPAVQP